VRLMNLNVSDPSECVRGFRLLLITVTLRLSQHRYLLTSSPLGPRFIRYNKQKHRRPVHLGPYAGCLHLLFLNTHREVEPQMS
jgi:hypothetical protein